ncbi:MAG: hypothetical protein GTO55_03765 [Armatimonadetes bacterium]|nr:hypothetical protein [Armatimonadota bacterium]NIM23391.1 hypothetical protein [Armatimonadota bacterium]NIM67256.1 hypothetical protein [Armatimonadota bacterium]NIM75754.1 hypothetical protein [Armatimonadota bacterium]NIN05442.1 hypothetical protein [Armatimonadota bacterium]
MLYLRLGAAGAPKKTILALLAEIWVAFVLVGVILASLSGLLGPSEARGAEEEFLAFAARIGRLDLRAQALFLVGLCMSIVLFARAVVSLRKVMRDYPLQ